MTNQNEVSQIYIIVLLVSFILYFSDKCLNYLFLKHLFITLFMFQPTTVLNYFGGEV